MADVRKSKIIRPKLTDGLILQAIGDGDHTYRIARRLKYYSTDTIRRRLARMQEAGKVTRDERYSYVNSICWRPLPAPPGGGGE